VSLRFETTPLAPLPPLPLDRLLEERPRPVDPRLRPAFEAHGVAADGLDALFADGALCVTTGQQPGLLTGPMFTLFKAVSACAVARAVAHRLGRPVVPVFWVAGDDHDFREANHVHVLDQDNELRELRLRDRDPSAPQLPLYREPLGEEIAHVLSALQEATPDTEFRHGVLEWIGRHYRPDATFADACAGAFAELLGPVGLVVLRSTHPAAKAAMAPLLTRALEEAPALDRALADRAATLRSQGAEAPVPVGEGATTVMIEGRLGRDRLVADGGRFVTRRAGENWTLDALRRVAVEDPTRLSPNVLLRPVVEAALLPTLAYAAGPSELEYLPQAAPLYEALGVTAQAAVPRWSARVLETRVSKVLEKYRLTPERLAEPPGALEAALVEDEMPPAAREALSALRRMIGIEYQRLQDAATAVDPTLKKSVASSRNTALATLADVEKRIVTHLKKQNDTVVQQIEKARRHLFPLGQPQERVLSPLPFLIRYGGAFLDDAQTAAGAWAGAALDAHSGAA